MIVLVILLLFLFLFFLREKYSTVFGTFGEERPSKEMKIVSYLKIEKLKLKRRNLPIKLKIMGSCKFPFIFIFSKEYQFLLQFFTCQVVSNKKKIVVYMKLINSQSQHVM